jgi:beta-lactamase regulating signal transducer with metallopeptidase domain
MESLFISVLNMSIIASYVIAAIMLVRLFLKKAPKTFSYALWAIAGLRLSVPFTIESIFSLMPFKSQPISQTAALGEKVSFGSSAEAALKAIGDAANGGLGTITVHLGKTADGNPITTSAYHFEVWLMFGSYIWIIGAALLLIYSVISIILLKLRLHSATPMGGNLYEVWNLKTPFVLGFIRPKIYIPPVLSEEEKSYIILHEQTHIKHFDHIVKMIAFLLLCVHWFNPFVWAAFLFMSADMEMSCDERVLKEIGIKIKHGYSASLLSLATRRRQINPSPLAFGEGNLKGRIKNILNFKKPAIWVIAVSILLVAVLIIGFTTNRPSANRPSADGSSDLEDYELPGNSNNHNLTLNDVRVLAEKGKELKFEDLTDFSGADVSSNTSYHLMVYTVKGGYRLIVRTDGNQIDITTLLGIWDSGDSGIDIRYNNVDEFIASHPSSENLTKWEGILTLSRDEVHKKMGKPDGILSGFTGDIYKLDDHLNIIIYYDADSNVNSYKIAAPLVDTSP